MQKEDFVKLLAAVEARKSNCESLLGGIHTTNDLKALTLEQAQEVQSFCKVEEQQMNKIMMVDLYHVIGMGNLAPGQMMRFVFAIRDYLAYRSVIKTLAHNFDRLSALPNIPITSKYKLLALADLTLTSGEGEVVEDLPSEDCLNLETEVRSKVLFELEGHTIKLNVADMEAFISGLCSETKVPLSVNNFKQKLAASLPYAGVNWRQLDEFTLVGVISNDTTYQRIKTWHRKLLGQVWQSNNNN